MAFEDAVRSVREFDLGDLDLDNVGSWPTPIKVLVWIILLVAVLVGGYYYHIEDLQLQLADVEKKDITNKGLLNGLDIASIDLQKERAKEFYVELPISIAATGSYHDLGAFISGMAGLPRIVTLHDFEISAENKNTNDLNMKIIAKTYRYKDEDS